MGDIIGSQWEGSNWSFGGTPASCEAVPKRLSRKTDALRGTLERNRFMTNCLRPSGVLRVQGLSGLIAFDRVAYYGYKDLVDSECIVVRLIAFDRVAYCGYKDLAFKEILRD